MAVRKVMVSLVDCQPSGVRWTGQLDWTPPDSTILQSGCFEWFSNGYGWPLSPVESGGVRWSPPESNRIMWGRDKDSYHSALTYSSDIECDPATLGMTKGDKIFHSDSTQGFPLSDKNTGEPLDLDSDMDQEQAGGGSEMDQDASNNEKAVDHVEGDENDNDEGGDGNRKGDNDKGGVGNEEEDDDEGGFGNKEEDDNERSLPCPTDSCRIPVIPAASGGI